MKPGEPSRVVFGHMHEDHALELSLIPRLPVRRALVIASGGDLAFALAAAEVEVLAVDSNPAQIGLVRQKMTCAPKLLAELCFRGKVDRFFRLGGWFPAWLLDWPRLKPGKFRRFLTRRLEALLPRAVFLIHGPEAAARLDRRAIRLMRDRLEKAMAAPGAAGNPLLQALLGKGFGPRPPGVWSPPGIARWRSQIHRITLKHTDLGQELQETAAGSLGLISVSNLPDTMSAAEWTALSALAAAALSPGGFLVVRSMLCASLPPDPSGPLVTLTHSVPDTSPLCPVILTGRKPAGR